MGKFRKMFEWHVIVSKVFECSFLGGVSQTLKSISPRRSRESIRLFKI